MAERIIACRDSAGGGVRGVVLGWLAAGLLMFGVSAWAQGALHAQSGPSIASTTSTASVPSAPAPATLRVVVPRITGRLHAADIGLVINTADAYSVSVGQHYIAARNLRPSQVLRVAIPTRGVLNRDEFEALQRSVEAHFGPATQALALAWAAPYAVECNAITGALALGFDAALCSNSCAASRSSGYFNSPSTRPLFNPGWRPSMLLAARTVEQAKALIDRGVAADGSLLRPNREAVQALLLTTDDAARRVRMAFYPTAGLPPAMGVELRVAPAEVLPGAQRLLLAITGSARVGLEPEPQWVPGGLGDHLTSFGADLHGPHGQSTVLDWIASGATASHGTVSEPCNHPQKFPHPLVLLFHYLQGSTAIEAYWKSVAWPQQSLFVGEPLAAPFARP